MVRRAAQTASEDAAPQVKVEKEELRQGHNGPRRGFAQEQLFNFAKRFERLTEEIGALTDDRKEVMAEAKAMGFDTKTLRVAIRRRAMAAADRQEADAMLELYEDALERAEKSEFAQSVKDGA